MTETFTPHLSFGLDPMWVSLAVLAVTYGFIIAGRFNRAVVALIGAVVVIIIGALDQPAALSGIDWDTIGLITGLMILVAISRRSGLFQYLAVWSAQRVKANPAGILLMLQVATAILSAVLNNVSTVLLIVPVTLAIAEELEVAAVPVLVRRSVCFQYRRHRNADRRSAEHSDRHRRPVSTSIEFLVNVAPVIVVIMAVQAAVVHLIWGRRPSRQPGEPRPGDGDECAGNDHRLGAAAPVGRWSCSRS